ncbi:iron-containing alcohol dehydrogenase family protein [Martelella alba]|uniref:Iron-containing alcohol dehydrogenase family protein n=1 Tax=Martelella alba TaxID=2590451 RepID=A0ABY2SED7_9HYPH|nr:iron-containing alcohol dehydrogenase family protein [Martelella alba]TKI02809.1 iron-containing alcohol dehydrogenase family protein [Martelella alba]
MRLSQVVRSGPGQYICESGALGYLPEKLTPFRRPYIIAGEKAFAAFQQFLPAPLDLPVLYYDGTASHEDMQRLSQSAREADVIIGIGGGRALDTAKGTAERLNIENILIPTVIGTCSACTPLSAVYHPDHTFKQVDYYRRAAYLVLLDLALLAASPRDYFVGGIGDTLAKWYEAEAITRRYDRTDLSLFVTMGLAAAKATLDTLLSDTPAALAGMNEGRATPAFRRVVEAVIAVAGMVGGCGGEYGRMAGAHAIHNALSYLPETHGILHGVKVAYGILVQLAATGDQDEVAKLIPFYSENGFPYNFASLGVTTPADTATDILAEFAAGERETFRLAVEGITPAQIAAAIRQVESIARQGAVR